MANQSERRRHERFTVDPMYSSVAVSRGTRRTDGHVYDVSLGGMRFELDRAVPKGAEIDVEIQLPGCTDAICAKARVVRVFDRIDDPGPRRMAVEFETFAAGSKAMLERYLGQKWLRRAPVEPAQPSRAMRSAITQASTVSSTTRSASAA